MNLTIIYEDKDIIVIDKPAGIAAHPKDTPDTLFTVVNKVSKHYPGIRAVGENPLRPGMVHRLDKETSGLMVVAKNNEAFFELKKQFQERKIEKKYIALVSEVLPKDSAVIDTPLIKIGTRTITSKLQPTISLPAGGLAKRGKQLPNDKSQKFQKARAAITEYKVLKRYKEYTLVEVHPKTGRQHQIRVHFASINHPVACDKLYGRRARKCPGGLRRHFLHASRLKFQLKNALMEFESELPRDLKKTLAIL